MSQERQIHLYPLSEKQSTRLKTPSGLSFQDITLEAVLEGKVKMEDLRVTAEALGLQAQIAQAAGRPQLADNFLRAAELTGVPEEKILRIYDALRPGRASQAELLDLAKEMEEKYSARRCAQLIQDAAEAYFKKPRAQSG